MRLLSRSSHRVFFLLFFFLHNLVVKAASGDTIVIEPEYSMVRTQAKETYWFTNEEMGIEEVVKQHFKKKDAVNLQYLTGNLWIKFVITNKSEANHFVLFTPSSHIAGYYFYKPVTEGYASTPVQKYHLEDGREIASKTPSFFVDMQKGETKTYFLKVTPSHEVVDLNFLVSGVSEFADYIQKDYLISGLFYGALVIILVVNVFYYFSLREKLYLIYCLYVVCTIGMNFCFNGFNWMTISGTFLANQVAYFFIRIWPDSMLFFVMHLVNLPKTQVKLTKTIYIFFGYHIALLGIVEALDLFDIMTKFVGYLEHVNYLVSLTFLIVTIAVTYKFNRYLFLYYTIGFGALILSILFISTYSLFGMTYGYLFFQEGMKVGTIVELMALSFAVSRRFKLTRDELKRQQEERKRLEEKVYELEMDVRRAQMKPHFMFNALNSIQSFVLSNERKEASMYLNKFAKLMRIALNHSRSQFVSLKDEIAGLRNYIDLELLRMQHVHAYEITIAEELKNGDFLIPPLLIQPFVENALRHGLQSLSTAGKMNISLLWNNNEVICTVEDEGAGMEQIKWEKNSRPDNRPSGIMITRERLTLIHQLMSTRNFVKMTNKSEETFGSTGTVIEFTVPYKRSTTV